MGGVCDQHGVVAQKMEELLTQMAVVVSTLQDMKDTKALNCEGRIGNLENDSVSFRKLRVGPRLEHLEENSDNCKELRVGPRINKVENRLDKLLWGGLTVAAINIFGVLFVVFKMGLK